MLNTKPLRVKLNPSFLLRSIHHPDPLTRQQTQRFLDAVTTSFRKNLDKEHGWPTSQEHNQRTASLEAPKHDAATTTDLKAKVASPADAPGSGVRRRPTDHHLASILSNPLFRPAPSVPKQPASKRDPMDVFDEAVSRGLMTVPIATGCLKAKQGIISNSRSALLDDEASASSERFSGFDISDRVLGWLRASGMESSLAFARHHNFIAALMPFLVAEGKDVIIWDWLTRLMSSEESHDEGSFAAARYILLYLVHSKTIGVECVDSALESIIQASETYRDDPRHGKLLIKAWRDVAWRTTSLAWQKPSPSVSLFDSYLGVANYLQSFRTKLPVAHLHLHHPATPTHDRAIEYLEQAKKEKTAPPERMRREALMGVDAVSHLGLIGELEEAKSLMNFINHKYSFFFRQSQSDSGDELLDQLEPA